jgi:hypothetical protein
LASVAGRVFASRARTGRKTPVCTENPIGVDDVTESPKLGEMIRLLCFVLAIWASPFKSKIRLAAENMALRHQLIVLRRKLRGRVQLTNSDRWFLVQLYRWFPSILKVLTIIRPETLVRWHRAGFRSYWRLSRDALSRIADE